MKFSRRSMLAGLASASAVSVAPQRKAKAATGPSRHMTLIDLTRCDGCEGRDTPACVAACRTENKEKFPRPDPAEIRDYWPQKKHEDWSDKQHLIDRLTPYNWLFVQNITAEHEGRSVTVNVPRRCMHCDNPPCAKLCPFGACSKTKEGPVVINDSLCFGGAKCRTVCPWNVPQRQAGVGLYTYLDPMPVGGGVMYKCDGCHERVSRGMKPACVTACPRGAMEHGPREEIIARAKQLARHHGGHLYGLDENGGTSTVYVSAVPFEALDRALVEGARNDSPKKKKSLMRLHAPKSMLEKHNSLGAASLAAPFIGAAAAFAATVSRSESARVRGEGDAGDAADEDVAETAEREPPPHD